jgi:hypothetical protein
MPHRSAGHARRTRPSGRLGLLATFSLCALVATSACSAQSSDNGGSGDGPGRHGPGQSGGPPPASAEMKAAFDACRSQGKPGDTAFDTCMASKGFKRPEGGDHRPPPPQQQ